MDDVVIRRVDSRGQTVGFDRFLGLFTTKAVAEEAQYVPILRAKLKDLIEAEHALPGSHDFKELVAAFNSFPKEELFRATTDELRKEIRFILDRMSEDRVRLSVDSDLLRGMVMILVVMPRERFSSGIQARIEEALARRFKGAPLYRHLAMGDGYTAHLHFGFYAPALAGSAIALLEREVIDLAQSWEERLHHQLTERMGEARGHSLSVEYGGAFSADYKASTEVGRAVADIEHIEAMIATRAAVCCRALSGWSDRSRKHERAADVRTWPGAGALRADAAVAKLRDPGAIGRRARAHARTRRETDAGLHPGVCSPRPRSTGSRRNAGRRFARRGLDRGAQWAGPGRSTERADAQRDAFMARGGAAPRLSRGRFPDEAGAGASDVAASLSTLSRPCAPPRRFLRRAPGSNREHFAGPARRAQGRLPRTAERGRQYRR